MTKIRLSVFQSLGSNLRAQLQEYVDWAGPLITEKSTTSLLIYKDGEGSEGGSAKWTGTSFQYASADENDPTPLSGIATGFELSQTIATSARLQFQDFSVSLVESYNALSVSVDAFLELFGDIEFFGGFGADVVQLGSGNDRLYGHDGDDTLYGMGGNDVFFDGYGNDMLYGGTGDDTYIIGPGFDTIIELPGEGLDRVRASVDFTLPDNVERLVLLYGPINGTGNTLDNLLRGSNDNNILDGKAGKDAMYGGAGNDTYVVSSSGDQTIELANEGRDTVRSLIHWTLGANVENLELQGTANLVGTGNSLDNSLTGNVADNTLRGGAGNDILNGAAGKDTTYGGIGNDVFIVSSTGDRTIELAGEGADTVRPYIDWTLGANIERLEFLGSANLTGNGNTLNNTLIGNSGDNILRGGAGDDTLVGGWGKDTLIGGDGNNTFFFNSSLDYAGVDRINDYNPAKDTIQLENEVFRHRWSDWLPTGWLSAGAFHTGTEAHDATDRIIYNRATGDLLFDPDGSGYDDPIKFATVAPGLAMTANDFFVV
ncbi:calcium-binding protein [Mesorhizobium sp. CGMCC 1.15528]|uniref:Calcium-binding protein n=1 Tax=Mesorhizobium zhangyense TaxID=1776730 RepID=A0A7C9VI29_9HYPH|nr:calcium-binding protein [Mesorhizobium zhangyense]NGN45008.1 calcium-binding protein [Mesorhizobium zhangyense]